MSLHTPKLSKLGAHFWILFVFLHRSHIVVQVSTPTKNIRLETLVFLVCHLTDENCSDFVHLINVARYLVAPGFGALGVYSESLTDQGWLQKIFAIHWERGSNVYLIVIHRYYLAFAGQDVFIETLELATNKTTLFLNLCFLCCNPGRRAVVVAKATGLG